VKQPIEQRGCDHGIAENLSSFGKASIGVFRDSSDGRLVKRADGRGECQGSCRLNSVTISPIDDAAVLAA
jgi:hypothetical protein